MHVRRALALTAVVPLLLAGCSDDPEPQPKMPDPPTSSSPSPTASETVEEESAEEFIRRWIEVNTQMQNTGQVEEYTELSRRCEPCIQTADRIARIYRDGGFVRTEGWILTDVVDRSGGSGAPVLDLRIKSSPTEFKESADAEMESLTGGDIVMRVRLSRSAPWQVTELTQVPS